MTIPSSYSSAQLQTYMHELLGPVGLALGWSVELGSYDEPEIDTLLGYGATSLADCTDIAKLRALAALAAWTRAEAHAAGLVTFTSFGDTYTLGDLQKRITASLASAQTRAEPYTAASHGATIRRVVYPNDPYVSRWPSDTVG